VPETDFLSETDTDGYHPEMATPRSENSIREDVNEITKGPTLQSIARKSGLSQYTTAKNLQKEVKQGEVYEHRDGRFQPLPKKTPKFVRGHSIVDEVRKSFAKSSHYGDGKKKDKKDAKKKPKKKKRRETLAERRLRLAKEREEGRHWAIPYSITYRGNEN